MHSCKAPYIFLLVVGSLLAYHVAICQLTWSAIVLQRKSDNHKNCHDNTLKDSYTVYVLYFEVFHSALFSTTALPL